MTIQDFDAYPFSNNQQISFIAAPILQYEEVVGVVVLKLNKDPVNAIIQRRGGMEKTAETYLVGKSDNTISYRSDRIVKKET